MKFTSGHEIRIKDYAREFRELCERPRYDMAGLPFITPETWQLLKEGCRRPHHPSTCPVCAYFSELDRWHYAAPWTTRHGTPHTSRWPSAEAALLSYWTIVRDGYPAGSVSGSIVAFGRLGCWAQSSGRHDSAAEHAADDAVPVEQALRTAFPGEAWRRSAAILLGRRGLTVPIGAAELADALGVAETEIAATVRRGMRAVRVELAARGLIPMPARDSAWFVEAVTRRQVMGDG